MNMGLLKEESAKETRIHNDNRANKTRKVILIIQLRIISLLESLLKQGIEANLWHLISVKCSSLYGEVSMN